MRIKDIFSCKKKSEKVFSKLIKINHRNFHYIVTLLSFYLRFRNKLFARKKSVLFAGQAYYNAWYLSRALRGLGWRADVLNWDESPASQIYYHGEDFRFQTRNRIDIYRNLYFYLKALLKYEVFHFSNMYGIQFGFGVSNWFASHFGKHYEIYLLKSLKKKIVYTNNGCLDGVSRTAFSKWGPDSVCNICNWRNEPTICQDAANLSWGQFRNEVADFQCLYGGNRVDFNDAPTVHEVPEFYCLNEEIWHPGIAVPEKYQLIKPSQDTVYLYHAVGNKEERTDKEGVNIKSSHIYLPLVEKLKKEGYQLELISPHEIPNREVRFLQVQADIFLEMLTYGWYGANAREAMMLAKPVICFIRPEWLASLREELPECAEEMPIISAMPSNIETILKDLILNPAKRHEIGEKSRRFALKWHSDSVAAKRFDKIYRNLLRGK